jgi:hypothetical protein
VERRRRKSRRRSARRYGLPLTAGGSRRDIPFGGDWNEKHYETRQVRPIFVEEATEIVVVTVYVYYF